MRQILEDLSAPAMVTAIETSLFEFFTLFRFWPGAEMHDDPDMLWTITDIPFSLFNSVLRAQLAPNNLDAAIEAAIHRSRSMNVPMLWWVGPATRPVDLGTHLERHGFSRDEDETGMAVDLLKLNEGLTTPPGLEIEPVNDLPTLKQWCHVFSAGFEIPEPYGQAFFDLFASLGFGAGSPIKSFLGRLNGEPVAISMLFLRAGVAGIYCVTTLPAARRLGVGAAMTLFPLLEARRQGYRAGILQASAMGASVYRRLGFQEYCKIREYTWMESITRLASPNS